MLQQRFDRHRHFISTGNLVLTGAEQARYPVTYRKDARSVLQTHRQDGFDMACA